MKGLRVAELNRDLIAKAALAVADEQGAQGFTIRAVAARLRVTPMALYHHVPDKAALAALVVDAAVSEFSLADSTGDWKEDLLKLACSVRASTLAHPALAHIRREYRIWTPAMLRVSERWLSLWRQSGLTPKKAVLAATSSSLAVHGLVNEEVLLRDADMPDPETLRLLPEARAMFTAKQDHKSIFLLGVRAIIDGLHVRLARA